MTQGSKVLSDGVLTRWVRTFHDGWAVRNVPSSAILGHYSVLSFKSVDVAALWFDFRGGDKTPTLTYYMFRDPDSQSVLMPDGWDATAALSAVVTCAALYVEKIPDLLPYTRGMDPTVVPTQEEKTRLRAKVQKGLRRESFQSSIGPLPSFLLEVISNLRTDHSCIQDLEFRKVISEVEERMKILAASGVDERTVLGLWRGVLVREAMEA